MNQVQDESHGFVKFHGTGKWMNFKWRVLKKSLSGLFRSKLGSRELWITMDLVDGVDLSRIVEGSEISSLRPDELRGVAAFLAYTLR